MKLTVREKRKASKITAAGYQRASKKRKGIILDEFMALTGYDRCFVTFFS